MKPNNCTADINGIILVNKPQGLSSNALLQKVKRLYQAKKAGHTGSLDPLATGMLPICLGEATKFCQFLLDADKCYEATGLLGIKTNTSDCLGEITEEISDFSVESAQLIHVLQQFVGSTSQIPSMYSALKYQGRPLYKYARNGIDIERKARVITIHTLDLNNFDGKHFDIRVLCSKGTYIRNLVEDIGDKLAVGAHVVKLHRLYTAGFTEEKMYSLEELEAKNHAQLMDLILPMERAVLHLPIQLLKSSEEVKTLRQGKEVQLDLNYLPSSLTIVRLHDSASVFIGLGELDSKGCLRVKRLLTEHAAMKA